MSILYKFTIQSEEEISWIVQNQIHKVLNIAYEGISKKFLPKTYGYEEPESRVLGWENEQVVSHMGIRKDTLIINNKTYTIGKMGLWSSISTTNGWATETLKESMRHLKEIGVKFAIGMTSNEIIINYVVPKFGNLIKLVNYPIIGSNYTSKPDAFGMLFNIDLSENDFEDMTLQIQNIGYIKILGEPF